MEVFMNDREFSDIQMFQRSGRGIPLFMIGHKNCLQADYLLGPGPRLIKKNLPGRGLTKVEKHCPIQWIPLLFPGAKAAGVWRWPTTPFSADVKEKVELFLHSHSEPSCPF
jgi:hypothetical protein